MGEPGTFVISIDTELAWGTFDTSQGIEPYEEAYRRTPSVVEELCSLFEKYDVPATWAVVAHLFEDCDGHHSAPDVDLNWIDDWYGSLPCTQGVDRDLWYSPEILDTIQSCDVTQEIGLHGYTHLILGAPNCERSAAEWEISAARDVLLRYDIDPTTFVFPRNCIGHRDVVGESGLEIARVRDDIWLEQWNIPRSVRKPFRFANELFTWNPPTSTPDIYDDFIELPGSQALRPFQHGWQFTPQATRFLRAKKGLDAAAKSGKVFHLRFHPFDFGFEPERMLNILEKIFKYALSLRQDKKITVQTVGDFA